MDTMPLPQANIDVATAHAFDPVNTDVVMEIATNRVSILNGCFDPITLQETVDWVSRWLQSGRVGYICTVNVAILMMMISDPQLQQFVDKAALIVADGQPLVWSSRLFSSRTFLPERVTGIDLVDALARLAEQEGFRVYLLGATSVVIQAAAQSLQLKYPKLQICGFNDGYFSIAEVPERVQAIRQSGAQILLVGMGVPRQEYFLFENLSDLSVNLAIPIGGSFDVIAGKKRRAPRWMQEYGLEWLYRLLQEPCRLWKRYLVTNSQFLCRLLRELLHLQLSRHKTRFKNQPQ
ncbi:MAG: WecB/TagA/CpsF family glycosyltransferase [Chroococcidiopsidaceae cyanobacterium CP_BM_ER_R8_30]|nr:WecB/TagA/CpsF family glycosyltransferase [Chroococcidiopsidaceae cyanobacterium CP_BM_ER_R8_30]